MTIRSAIVDDAGRAQATATGSGFFVGRDLVLTCNHVVNIPMGPRRVVAANQVQVDMDGGATASAEVVGRDASHDLALLRLPPGSGRSDQALSVAPFSLTPGDSFTVVGDFPDAIRVTRGQLVTPVVMNGFAMGDAKVRSGFSGGPVLSADGQVQGILSQRDMQNNSIFVRSEHLLALMRRQGVSAAQPKPDAVEDEETDVEASADRAVAGRGKRSQNRKGTARAAAERDVAAADTERNDSHPDGASHRAAAKHRMEDVALAAARDESPAGRKSALARSAEAKDGGRGENSTRLAAADSGTERSRSKADRLAYASVQKSARGSEVAAPAKPSSLAETAIRERFRPTATTASPAVQVSDDDNLVIALPVRLSSAAGSRSAAQ